MKIRHGRATVLRGESLHVLRGLRANSIDALVTDPPAGIGFMGKKWDEPGAMVERRPDTSGSTGVACALEGFRFIGIERERAYFAVARRRIREAA